MANAPSWGWLAVSGILVMTVVPHGASDRIQVISHEAGKRVDIVIDGKPFTSYIYPSSLKEAGVVSAAHGDWRAGHPRLSAGSAPG